MKLRLNEIKQATIATGVLACALMVPEIAMAETKSLGTLTGGHGTEQVKGIYKFAIALMALLGIGLVGISAWTWWSLSTGRANQMQQQAGGVGVLVGFIAGAILVAVTLAIEFATGTFLGSSSAAATGLNALGS